MTIKAIFNDVFPPIIWRSLISLKRILVPSHDTINLEGDFATWEEASSRCTGYDDSSILAKVLEATLKVKRGEAVYERDSVLFDEIQYSWPVLAGLMWTAARNNGRLNVLDFGGSLGSSYFQNRKFLSSIPEVRWNVIEQSHYVEAGKAHIQDEQLQFYKTIGDCLEASRPNVVFLSSLLQYLPEPYSLLKLLLKLCPDTVILDRTCYVNQTDHEVIKIQHTPSSIYAASYPIRYFVEDELHHLFTQSGYVLLESFDSLDKLDAAATWKGHIFVRDCHE